MAVVQENKVVTESDIGKGLEIGADKKLQVKVDGTSIQVDDEGILKAIQQVDVKLAGLKQVPGTKTLRATLSDGSTTVDIDLTPFFPEGVVPNAIGLNDENKLEITLSDGTKVTSANALYHTHLKSLGDVDLGKTVA